jgi:hypothetical protein
MNVLSSQYKNLHCDDNLDTVRSPWFCFFVEIFLTGIDTYMYLRSSFASKLYVLNPSDCCPAPDWDFFTVL